MRNRLAAVAVAGTLAAGVAAPLATAAPAGSGGNVVRIAALASGLQYSTKTLRAAAGKITLVFTNRSQLQHNVRLEIGEKEFGGTKTIGHGTTSVTLTLKKGVYHYYCSVPGHEDAGMSGYLTVS